MNRAALILGLSLLASGALCGEPAADGRQLMERYVATLPADETVDVTMAVYRRVGVAELKLDRPVITVVFERTVVGSGENTRIRLDVKKPPSMVGIAMVATWEPREKKFRVLRFLPGRPAVEPLGYLGGAFLESHLLYEHLLPPVLDKLALTAKEAVKVGDVDCDVVEAVPQGEAAYSKVIYYLRKDNGAAAKVEYCKRAYRGEEVVLTRQVTSADAEEWLAGKTGEKTVLTFSDRRKAAAGDDRFKPESMISDPGQLQLMQDRAKMVEELDQVRTELRAVRAEMEKLRAGTK